MCKICPACNGLILNNSKQSHNQIYCTTKCRKKHHRRNNLRVNSTRLMQKEANLLLNDEMRYVVSQCKYARTVQILSGHTPESYMTTMALISNKPPGHVHLCHIAPIKGLSFIGLLHHRNLFYGGDYQNMKFRNKYAGGGRYIALSDLDDAWAVDPDMPNLDVLQLIKAFLGPILADYIKNSSIRKSKRYQLAKKIVELDSAASLDKLLELSFNELSDCYKIVTQRVPYKPPKLYESKFLAYLDSLTRFIEYNDARRETLEKLRKIMVIAYMALERVEASGTFNKDFYLKYEPLVQINYGQAMLRTPSNWSEFKDLVYQAAFETLQGFDLDIRRFRKKVMSYLHFPLKAWKISASPWEYKMIYQHAIG